MVVYEWLISSVLIRLCSILLYLTQMYSYSTHVHSLLF